MKYIIECTVLRSTFVLQTQLLFDKVGPQMLPDAGISAQLDLGILLEVVGSTKYSNPTPSRYEDKNTGFDSIQVRLWRTYR